jgi:glucokinase
VQGREGVRRVIGALDIGGTHVTAARVDPGAEAVAAGSRRRFPLDPDGAREELVGGLLEAAASVAGPSTRGWGIAAPGPFDYERGVFRIRGLGKFEALFGVDLHAELFASLGLADDTPVRFLNDADAFLLGEAWAGAARGHPRVVGLTLGTGLGSAFLADGRLVHDGAGVFPGGRAHVVDFRGRPVEETISRRGLLGAHRAEGTDVKELAERARDGDAPARSAFTAFAAALAEFLEPWLAAFEPTCVVVGGSIARAWDLLGPPLEAALAPVVVSRAAHLDDAPLLGAARWVELDA